jgi:hypothetical protein
MKSYGRSALNLLVGIALLSQHAAAFSTATTTLKTSSASSSLVYQGLQSTPLVRASDASPVLLTNLWRVNTPLGIADEYAVCTFLRHYG